MVGTIISQYIILEKLLISSGQIGESPRQYLRSDIRYLIIKLLKNWGKGGWVWYIKRGLPQHWIIPISVLSKQDFSQ